MKKGYQVILIAVAILLGTGVVATGAGLLMGGSLRDASQSLISVGDGAATTGISYLARTVGNKEDWVVLKDESYTDVSSLEIDAYGGEIVVQEGDTFAVYVEGSSAYRIVSVVENGEWRIEASWPKGWRGKTKQDMPNGYTMQVTLPKGWQAKELDIDIGAGVLTADLLRSSDTDITVGAGRIEIGRLESSKTDIECGMGVVEVTKALVTGRTKMDCGMGEIAMEIVGKETDYGIDYSVGMGRVVVGSNTAAAIGAQNRRSMDSASFISIECGMGVVEVSFTERV